MNITQQTINDEGLQGQLSGPAPLAEATYRLYMCRPNLARPAPRVVVLHTEEAWKTLEQRRRLVSVELEPDAASDLLWRTLSANGERIGEVATADPEPEDHVFYQDGDHFRVALPVPEHDGVGGDAEEADWISPSRSRPDRGLHPELRLMLS